MHLEISSDVWPFKGEFNEKEKEKYFRDIQTLRGIKKKEITVGLDSNHKEM
jgi:hypothetical protein